MNGSNEVVLTDLGGAYKVGEKLLELRFTIMSPEMYRASLGAVLPGPSHDIFVWGMIMHELIVDHDDCDLNAIFLERISNSPSPAKACDLYERVVVEHRNRFPQTRYRPLLLSMTRNDPKSRPSIDEVLCILRNLKNP